MGRKPRQKRAAEKARPTVSGVANQDGPAAAAATGGPGPVSQPRPPKAKKYTQQRSGLLKGRFADVRARLAVCVALLFVLGFSAYSNNYSGAWVLDDTATVLRNTGAQAGATFDRLMLESRPITMMTFGWNWTEGSEDPSGYHFTNNLFHVLCAVLIFFLGRATLLLPFFEQRYRETAEWLALAGAALFVLHPAQTGAVTYIVQRSETLAAMALVAGLLLATRFRAPRDWLVGAVSVLVVGVLGVYSKETGIVIPALFLAYDLCFLSRGNVAELRSRAAIYVALGLVFLSGLSWTAGTLEVGAQASDGGNAGFQVEGLSPFSYLLNQIPTVGYYFRQTFFPDAVCFDCGYYGSWPVENSTFGNSFVVWGGLLAAIVASALAAWRRFPLWTFAVLGTGIVLGPTSSFVPLTDVYVPYRMYLCVGLLGLASSVAVFELGQAAVARGVLRDRAASGLCLALLGVVCATFMVQTLGRNALFSDPEALWKDSLVIAPQNRRVHYNLGNIYRRAERYEEALAAYQDAAKLKHDVAKVHVNIGVVLNALGRANEGTDAYREAYRIDPNFKTAQRNLLRALVRSGHYAEAEKVAQDCADARPNASGFQTQLAGVLEQIGKPQKALQAYQVAYERGDHSKESVANITRLGGVPGR